MVKKRFWNTPKILIVIAGALLGLFIWFFFVLDSLRIFVPYYPWIAGFPFASKQYLIVLQNDAELRPGGGFTTAYGLLRMAHGFPVGFEINDVFSLSTENSPYIQPPYPMEDLLKGPFYHGWAFQDANWYADFPQNAKQMIWFYQKKFPDQHIDGVIAVNFRVVEELLDILGPVRAGEVEFDRHTLFSSLEHEVSNIDRHNIEDLKNRKEILKDFYQALLKKIIFSPILYHQMTRLIVQSLNQKDIQLYFSDALVHNAMERRGWSATIPLTAPDRDFLAVVEANLAGMKSDRYIQRQVAYDVDYTGDKATAHVTIAMTHRGDYNEPLSFTYKGFVRILVPKNSVMVGNDPEIVQGEESGYKFLGKKIQIEPGSSAIIEFTYVLPDSIVRDGQYRLTVLKQSGTNDQYTISFHAPADFVLDGKVWDFRDNLAMYTASLDQDLDLALRINPDRIPPRVTFQIFKELQVVELHFNEDIDIKSCAVADNYHLIDADVKDPRTDQIRVVDVECGDRGLTIHLAGVTEQPEEHYKLTLGNIRDKFGTTISPNPRTVTIVQRLGGG